MGERLAQEIPGLRISFFLGEAFSQRAGHEKEGLGGDPGMGTLLKFGKPGEWFPFCYYVYVFIYFIFIFF